MNKVIPSRQLKLWLIAAALAVLSPALADTLLLRNGVIHTISGDTITNGSVLIENGKIKSVMGGTNQFDLTGDTVVDLLGPHVYPGMIALNSAAGLSEIEAGG